MKQVFVEPKLKKIELNMKENIASSIQQSMGYYFMVTLFSCTIVTTGKFVGSTTEEEAEPCLINPNARIGGGIIVPVDEVRSYFRM